MKHILALLILSIGVTFALAEEIADLPNLQQPRFNVFTAGQPTERGFLMAGQMGVKTVLNVLPEKDCIPDEAKLVQNANMTYKRLPFETSGFKRETIAQFAAIVNESEKPILIHCSTGNHVGGLWFAYRALVDKAPLGQALKEARRIGMTPQLENNMFDWVANQTSIEVPAQQIGK